MNNNTSFWSLWVTCSLLFLFLLFVAPGLVALGMVLVMGLFLLSVSIRFFLTLVERVKMFNRHLFALDFSDSVSCRSLWVRRRAWSYALWESPDRWRGEDVARLLSQLPFTVAMAALIAMIYVPAYGAPAGWVAGGIIALRALTAYWEIGLEKANECLRKARREKVEALVEQGLQPDQYGRYEVHDGIFGRTPRP